MAESMILACPDCGTRFSGPTEDVLSWFDGPFHECLGDWWMGYERGWPYEGPLPTACGTVIDRHPMSVALVREGRRRRADDPRAG